MSPRYFVNSPKATEERTRSMIGVDDPTDVIGITRWGELVQKRERSVLGLLEKVQTEDDFLLRASTII